MPISCSAKSNHQARNRPLLKDRNEVAGDLIWDPQMLLESGAIVD